MQLGHGCLYNCNPRALYRALLPAIISRHFPHPLLSQFPCKCAPCMPVLHSCYNQALDHWHHRSRFLHCLPCWSRKVETIFSCPTCVPLDLFQFGSLWKSLTFPSQQSCITFTGYEMAEIFDGWLQVLVLVLDPLWIQIVWLLNGGWFTDWNHLTFFPRVTCLSVEMQIHMALFIFDIKFYFFLLWFICLFLFNLLLVT